MGAQGAYQLKAPLSGPGRSGGEQCRTCRSACEDLGGTWTGQQCEVHKVLSELSMVVNPDARTAPSLDPVSGLGSTQLAVYSPVGSCSAGLAGRISVSVRSRADPWVKAGELTNWESVPKRPRPRPPCTAHSPGRHCRSTLSLAVVGGHSLGP